MCSHWDDSDLVSLREECDLRVLVACCKDIPKRHILEAFRLSYVVICQQTMTLQQ